ncbi:YhcB family protein [Neptuniibacter halophilus]|uniref:YhcB family protein n=1 Tax=Neptuniibacter halophilus TaxID=651666 RepID=UPI0025726627|nr:DUF1043 family protein [Neptuniibacter halophilus]
MENIWLISIVALVVGAVIGYLLGRSGGGSGRQAELAEQLEDAKRELESYRSEVTGHFEKTAQLVNGLTQSYKEVHEHLASGAQGLCQPGAIDMALEPAMTPKLEEGATEPAPAETEKTEESGAEPPRDYAPKAPEEEGTLSETFGLKEKAEDADADTASDTPADSTATEKKESAAAS